MAFVTGALISFLIFVICMAAVSDVPWACSPQLKSHGSPAGPPSLSKMPSPGHGSRVALVGLGQPVWTSVEGRGPGPTLCWGIVLAPPPTSFMPSYMISPGLRFPICCMDWLLTCKPSPKAPWPSQKPQRRYPCPHSQDILYPAWGV